MTQPRLEAPATLVIYENQWGVPKSYLWVLVACPHCGKKHLHGGGHLDSNPLENLGWRVPHCFNDGQYYLIEADPVETKKTVQRVKKMLRRKQA